MKKKCLENVYRKITSVGNVSSLSHLHISCQNIFIAAKSDLKGCFPDRLYYRKHNNVFIENKKKMNRRTYIDRCYILTKPLNIKALCNKPLYTYAQRQLCVVNGMVYGTKTYFNTLTLSIMTRMYDLNIQVK